MYHIILLPLHSLLVYIIYLTVVIITVSLLAWPQIPLIASSTPTRSTSSFIEVAHSFLRYVLYQNEIAFKNLCLFCCCVVKLCLIQNFVLRTTFLSFQYRIEQASFLPGRTIPSDVIELKNFLQIGSSLDGVGSVVHLL